MNIFRLLKKIGVVLFMMSSAAPVLFAEQLPLLPQAEKSGMQVYWDTLSGSGLLEKNGHQISFRAGEQIILLDSRKLAITDAPELQNDTIVVSKKFIDDAESFFKSESTETLFRVG